MASYPYRLRNTQNRPVEIHRSNGVLVLNPGEFMTLDSVDPACDLLESGGILSRHKLKIVINKKSASKETSKARRKAKSQGTSKPKAMAKKPAKAKTKTKSLTSQKVPVRKRQTK